MNDEPIEIKKQTSFDATLADIIPEPERREEVERAIRFAARIPGMGKDVGLAHPLAIPLYALPLRKSAFNSPLVVYYCRHKNTVILMSVKITEATQE